MNHIKKYKEFEKYNEELGIKDILTGGLITLGTLGSLHSKGQDIISSGSNKPTTTVQSALSHHDSKKGIIYSDDQAEIEVRDNMIVVYTINKFFANTLHNNPYILKYENFYNEETKENEYIFVLKKDESTARFLDGKIKMYQKYTASN